MILYSEIIKRMQTIIFHTVKIKASNTNKWCLDVMHLMKHRGEFWHRHSYLCTNKSLNRTTSYPACTNLRLPTTIFCVAFTKGWQFLNNNLNNCPVFCIVWHTTQSICYARGFTMSNTRNRTLLRSCCNGWISRATQKDIRREVNER